MTRKQKIQKITDELYRTYGTDSGHLLGLEPKYRDTVQAIIRFTLDYNKEG